jgi:RNA polymerase sigma-70 factor (ECF subfamily)
VEETNLTPAAGHSFEEFYLREFDRVYRFAVGLVGDAEAWDVTQEAFARTWSVWGEVGQSQRPASFTFKVASNVAATWLRRLYRWRALQASMHRVHEEASTRVSDEMALAIRIEATRLPLRQRQALLLCDLIGLKSEEAAATLGVRSSTLRVHLARGRKALRERLNERPTEHGISSEGSIK